MLKPILNSSDADFLVRLAPNPHCTNPQLTRSTLAFDGGSGRLPRPVSCLAQHTKPSASSGCRWQGLGAVPSLERCWGLLWMETVTLGTNQVLLRTALPACCPQCECYTHTCVQWDTHIPSVHSKVSGYDIGLITGNPGARLDKQNFTPDFIERSALRRTSIQISLWNRICMEFIVWAKPYT